MLRNIYMHMHGLRSAAFDEGLCGRGGSKGAVGVGWIRRHGAEGRVQCSVEVEGMVMVVVVVVVCAAAAAAGCGV